VARLRSPIMFLVLMLLPFALYFTGWRYWWGLQIGVQLLLCLTALFFSCWRLTAAFSLILLLAFNLPWLQIDADLPAACQRQIDSLSGIVELDRNDVTRNLRMQKVEIWCQSDFKRWPAAELRLQGDNSSLPGWFRNGDRIEFRNIAVSARNAFTLDLLPATRVSVTNISNRQRILDRNELLIYVQKKARYFLSGFPHAVYNALLTADRSSLTDEWRQRFNSLGIAHLFAISGMHIGILYLWFSLSLRRVVSVPAQCIERGAGVLITDLIAILTILLILKGIGMPVSAKRAFIMLAWWGLIRHFLGWQPLWFILCGAAVIILLDSPVAVGQLSFQLSFLSVAGIIQILPFLPRRRLRDSFCLLLLKLLAASFAVSLWLFVLTMPLVGILINQPSLITPLTNVIHIYFLSFVYFPAALLATLITLLGYPLGGWPFDFYLYAILNFLGRFWEQMLVMNDSISDHFLFQQFDFRSPLPVAIWILIAVVPFLIRWRRPNQEK